MTQTRYSMLSRYSLSKQLMAGFVALGIVAVATATISFYGLSHIEEHVARKASVARQVSALADEIAIDTLQCRRYEKDMFLNMATAVVAEHYHNKWTAALGRLQDDVMQLRSVATDGDSEDAQAWKTLLVQYEAAVGEVLTQIQSGQVTKPSEANQAITPYKHHIRQLTRSAIEKGVTEREASKQIDQRMLATIAQYRSVACLLAGVSLVFGMCLAWWFSSLLSRRAKNLCDSVEELAAGHYVTRIALDGKDEFSILGRAIDGMAKRIQERTAQAEAASVAKSEFLANMSHEIRTPMTAILGYADQLLEMGEIQKAPQQRIDAIDTIRRNGGALLGLINDILDLSKIETGKMSVEQTDFRPCHVIAEVASLMRVRADAKRLPFHIEYGGAIPETMQSDPTRLRQILINLVGNAIKFTEVGAVRLVTRMADDGEVPALQFDVIDTGRGMTPEQVAKLFEPFTQADNSTTREFGGTGLGLTISKRFAELLGGDVVVAETDIGVGTTFRATLPTGSLEGVVMLEDPMSATAVTDTANAVAQAPQSSLNGLCILLAEDGPDNQRLIAFVLKKADADVTVVENGKLAMDAALAARDEGKPFDCILMDMQMPVMDGYEATGQLRKKGYAAPIIALTAHAMADDRQKCISAGCDDYATKPIDRKKLIATIQQHTLPVEVTSAAAT